MTTKIAVHLTDISFRSDGRIKRNEELKRQVYEALAEHKLPVMVILNEKKNITACAMDKNTFRKDVLMFLRRTQPFAIKPETEQSIKDDWKEDLCLIVDDNELELVTLYQKKKDAPPDCKESIEDHDE